MTILVVDDSRLMRNCIKSLVREFVPHCAFIEAENGEEAFKLVQTRGVDFVFLDWEMPKMNGMEFLKAVRGKELFKNLSIIMITSANRQEHIAEALAAGVTDYILKPIKNNSFKEKMYKHLAGKD